MAFSNEDFVTYQGDDVSPIFTVYAADGTTIVDISSVSQITWTARRDLDTTVAITKTKTAGQITFPALGTDGRFQVLITKTDTAALSGYYLHQATITDALGNVTTVTIGRLQVGVAPVWTYDAGQLASSTLYQVRRIIGDVITGDQQLSDAEINFNISTYSNVYLAAAECCRQLATQYARLVDLVQGELKTNYSNKTRAYTLQAKDLERRGFARSGVLPYAGGISVQDKIAQEDNADRVSPQFNIGMQDNLLPLSPIGNETPGSPDSVGGNS